MVDTGLCFCDQRMYKRRYLTLYVSSFWTVELINCLQELLTCLILVRLYFDYTGAFGCFDMKPTSPLPSCHELDLAMLCHLGIEPCHMYTFNPAVDWNSG